MVNCHTLLIIPNKGRREKLQASDGEGGACFVQAADHDAGFSMPCQDGATMTEGPPQILGHKAKAQDPENGQGSVDGEIVLWWKSMEVV